MAEGDRRHRRAPADRRLERRDEGGGIRVDPVLVVHALLNCQSGASLHVSFANTLFCS